VRQGGPPSFPACRCQSTARRIGRSGRYSWGCSARQRADSRKLLNRPFPSYMGNPSREPGPVFKLSVVTVGLAAGVGLLYFPIPVLVLVSGFLIFGQDSLAEARPLVGVGGDDRQPGRYCLGIGDRLRRLLHLGGRSAEDNTWGRRDLCPGEKLRL
jgi:hypothetical protein